MKPQVSIQFGSNRKFTVEARRFTKGKLHNTHCIYTPKYPVQQRKVVDELIFITNIYRLIKIFISNDQTWQDVKRLISLKNLFQLKKLHLLTLCN